MEKPLVKDIEKAVSNMVADFPAIASRGGIDCRVSELQFRKYKPQTVGVLVVELCPTPGQADREKLKIIVKGIYCKGKDVPHEAKVLSNSLVQSEYNSLRPPKLYHTAVADDITWLFMEEVKSHKLSINWNNKNLGDLGYTLGSFNGFFSGEVLEDLMWIDTGYCSQYLQQGEMQASSIVESLEKAGEAGYKCALLAADSLKCILDNYSYFKKWLLSQPICLSHNDTTPENIYLQSDGVFRAIDWESCTLCPIGFDPIYPVWGGSVLGSASYNEDALLKGYRNGLLNSGINIPYDELSKIFSFHIVLRAINHKGLKDQWDSMLYFGAPQPALMFGCWWALESTTLLVAKHAKKLVSIG